jgi:hypothetical protein
MTSMLPIGELAILADPIKEFIISIRQGAGVIYEPYRIVKRAKAEAEAKLIAANAEAKVKEIEVRGKSEADIIKWQDQTRIDFLKERRQRNINQIVDTAINQLPEKISEEKPDEDWLVEFFNSCQDVSNEKMQDLWAKILAGEFSKPNTFSLRTLFTVKLLNQQDAEAFRSMVDFIWADKYIIPRSSSDPLIAKRINSQAIVRLKNIGLLYAGDPSWTIEPDSSMTINYFNTNFDFQNAVKHQVYLGCYQLTQTGIELLSLCDRHPDDEYIKDLIDVLASNDILMKQWGHYVHILLHTLMLRLCNELDDEIRVKCQPDWIAYDPVTDTHLRKATKGEGRYILSSPQMAIVIEAESDQDALDQANRGK